MARCSAVVRLSAAFEAGVAASGGVAPPYRWMTRTIVRPISFPDARMITAWNSLSIAAEALVVVVCAFHLSGQICELGEFAVRQLPGRGDCHLTLEHPTNHHQVVEQ